MHQTTPRLMESLTARNRGLDSDHQLVLYPVPPKGIVSENYSVEINGQPVYVECISGFSGGDVSWVSFDFEGQVTVSVTAMRNVGKVEVCPASAQLAVGLDGNTATVTLDKPCRLFLKWDDGFELPFHIFANALEEDAPTPGAERVHFFGPGKHHPGLIRLKDDETLYLAGGATVYGVVLAEGVKGAKICGRGILCTSHLDRKTKETYQVDGVAHEVICFRDSSDLEIEGITILDSHHWTVTFYNCDQVHVANLKMFNERNFSTDGINPVNCRDVLIEDCFARCKDDCISIKGLDKKYPNQATPIRNIVVQNCVFWSDNNNGVVVGSETKAQTISGIVFRNLDLIRVSNTCGDYAGALSIICLHDTDIHDILFEDIRIEHSSGPYFNIFYTDSIFRIPGARQPEGGSLRNIHLKNISVTGGPVRFSYIAGYDERRLIENVTIENLRIHGKLVHNAAEGKIYINPYVRNVKFIAG